MTVRLRAHHLLCTLAYVGKGYDPAFVANFDRLMRRLSGGEDILLVEGPDDICQPLLADPAAHCHRRGVTRRDATAARQIAALLGRPVDAGCRLVPSAALLAELRAAFAARTIRGACHGCEWRSLCSDIADGGFDGVRWQVVDQPGGGSPAPGS